MNTSRTVLSPRTFRGRERGALILLTLAAALLSVAPAAAKTRWSSLQFVPDADFLAGGQFSAGLNGFYSVDEEGNAVVRPGAGVRFGVMEWVNIHAGYSGGATLGLKARLLAEDDRFIPCVALGVHNIVTHVEPYYFNTDAGRGYSNEFFLALGKTVEQLKTRFHLGVQSMPTVDSEKINPFLAIEKYFGSGLYLTFEAHTRDRELHPSLFASYRMLSRKLELSVGVVEIRRMLFDERNAFALSLNRATGTHGLVRPGIWFGMRYLGDFGAGGRGGFGSFDERIAYQNERIDTLTSRFERLQRTLDAKSTVRGRTEGESAGQDAKDHLYAVIMEKLMTVRTLFETHPYDPEKVRSLLAEVGGYRTRAVPPLTRIAFDREEERFVRRMAISLLGEIGDRDAGPLLLDLMGQTHDPDLRVEIIVALGKVRETRASYLLEQLSSDPDDAVAFAAREVLRKLVEETGIEPPAKGPAQDTPPSIPESPLQEQ